MKFTIKNDKVYIRMIGSKSKRIGIACPFLL
nr:MAG TPA: hypothetical protein [Caudoviricetes sp.]